MQRSFGRRTHLKTAGVHCENARSHVRSGSHMSNLESNIREEKEGGRFASFFIACVSGMVASVLACGLFIESNAPGFFLSRFFLAFAMTMPAMTLLPFFLISSRVLADVMRLLRVPRGYSDILIGALIGSFGLLAEFATGQPINWINVSFAIGGAFGGFTYWRHRGYPGLQNDKVPWTEKLFFLGNRI